MSIYQCPLQVNIERLQEVANDLRSKAINVAEARGYIYCYVAHRNVGGLPVFTCILLSPNIEPQLLVDLVQQGKTTKEDDLITFKKYLSYTLKEDEYIVF